MRSKVEKQANSNQSLSMQVDELASLSNIQDIAKEYGLSYNNDNIIVIGETGTKSPNTMIVKIINLSKALNLPSFLFFWRVSYPMQSIYWTKRVE